MDLATRAPANISLTIDTVDPRGILSLAEVEAKGWTNLDTDFRNSRNSTDSPGPTHSWDCGTDAMPGSDDAELDDHLDLLCELGDEIATLAAHLNAGTYRLLTLIAEFDQLQGWEPGGHRSCAHWLAFRTGINLDAAREKVRAARSLTELSQISASMKQGELSFTQVRALTRVATPESEGDLLELAQCSTAAQLERTICAWRRMCRFDENEVEKIRHRSRCLSVFPDEEGMYVVRGRLDPEVGAMLMRAIEAASDALFRAGTAEDSTVQASASMESTGPEPLRDWEVFVWTPR